MGFLKKLFGTEEEKQDSKPKVKQTQPKQVKESKQESNSFLDQLELIINEAKMMVSKSPKVDTIQNLTQDIVEGFFYGNVIINFKNNLNEENQTELNISDKDITKIEKKFDALFERCEQTLESGSNKGKVNLKEYKDFKKELKQISENSYKLLLELEKHIDISTCQNRIKEFKEEIKSLGKELKIGNVESEDGSLGISIGFDGDDEDYEDSDIEEKITDFDNFSLEMDEEWLTLEDKQGGHFYGQYHISKNKKYIVGFCDGYEDASKGKSKWVAGQVYLIENKNKILWKKEIARPEHAFVNNKGVVFVVDWVSTSGELTGKIYLFDDKGKKLFEHKFDSNIGGQEISDDGEEVIITTCFPENAIYLFNLTKKELTKKINNTTKQRPLINFKFKEIKELVLNEEPYSKPKESKRKEELSPFEELMDKGYECRNSGKFKKGIDYFKEAMKIKTTGSLLKGIAYCYQGLGDFKEAIKFFEKAMEISPYQRKMLPKYIELCKRKKKSFDECSQDEIESIYLKAEGRDLKKERNF